VRQYILTALVVSKLRKEIIFFIHLLTYVLIYLIICFFCTGAYTINSSCGRYLPQSVVSSRVCHCESLPPWSNCFWQRMTTRTRYNNNIIIKKNSFSDILPATNTRCQSYETFCRRRNRKIS
jgi:hypothetical protein